MINQMFTLLIIVMLSFFQALLILLNSVHLNSQKKFNYRTAQEYQTINPFVESFII